MRYLERIARGGPGAFHTAIATTFGIEFSAFEKVVLPLMMASGVKNILVAADGRMAALSLSDGSELPVQLGRDYEMITPPVTGGVFHPKILLQLGRRSGRLFVGSANLTAAGVAGNAETVVEVEWQGDPGPEQAILRAAWRYLEQITPPDARGARDALAWAAERTPWLASPISPEPQTLTDGTLMAFLTNEEDPGIGQRFVALASQTPIDRLIVISPYWDHELRALEALSRALSPKTTTLFLDPEHHAFPSDAPRPEGAEVRALPAFVKGRFAHAKIIIASSKAHDHVLAGSANCTLAALGHLGRRGINAEACLYRRLARDQALDALGLGDALGADPLSQDALEPPQVDAPIPLVEIGLRQCGRFELEGAVLRWTPPGRLHGGGLLRLLNGTGATIGELAFGDVDPAGHIFQLPTTQIDGLRFVVVNQDGFESTPAHVTNRTVLRQRRRETASGSIATHVGKFEGANDFDDWMLSALDALARADFAERAASSIVTGRRRRSDDPETEAPGEILTYDAFMNTRTPDRRLVRTSQNALAGTHTESVRGFLNLLVGYRPPDQGPEACLDGDDAWMDLGDDGEGLTREHPPPPPPPPEAHKTEEVDAGLYERLVRAYAATLAGDQRPVGAGDVLRLRFWLMLLLHKARHAGLKCGLSVSTGETGWPRMATRAIGAFFCGPRAPITRLVVPSDCEAVPTDFLECWATVHWMLDAIEEVLTPYNGSTPFLNVVRKLRGDVLTVLALAPGELRGDTALNLRSALDVAFESRLQPVMAPPLRP